MLYEDYTPPSWSMRPKLKYYLEVIKDGVEMQQMPIDGKAMYLVGKSEQSDIVLDNPTVSRKHAVIQSKNSDEMFVFDLGSTNGTIVNRQKIPTKLYHKLKPFDQLQFGQSKRIYILRCVELEEEDKLDQEKKIEERIERKKQKQEYRSIKDQYLSLLYSDHQYAHMRPKGSSKIEDGIDWGISDEYEVYRYQQEQEYPMEPEILKKLPNLSQQMLDKIDKYAEKLHIYRSTQGEFDEVLKYEKNNLGLDESRAKKKGNLENKMDELGSELERLEHGLKFSLFGEKVQKKEVVNEYQDSSEDDDYYDRTKLTNQKKEQNIQVDQLEKTTENFKDLKIKLDQLLLQKEGIEKRIQDLQSELSKYFDEDDELEQVMRNNISNVINEERPKLLQELQQVNSEISKVNGWLKKVQPEKIQITSYFNDDEKDEKDIIDQKELQEKKVKSSITNKLKELKRLQQQEIDENDEEAILKKAQEDFKLQEEYESRKQKEKERQQRIRDNKNKKDTDSEEEEIKKKIYSAKPKQIHSRHYTASEIEKEDVVDLTKFM